MIAKTKVIKKYYLTEKEVEKIYYKLNTMNMSPSEYALSKGVSKTTFLDILYIEKPLTKNIYEKAFKDLNCIDKIPKEYGE